MASALVRTLHTGDSGDDVRAVQVALNARAAPRDYPPIRVDGVVGPSTVWAYHALGYAVGFLDETLRAGITPDAQRLLIDPSQRVRAQLVRERERAPRLASRTIAFDGTPVFWGLAKPLQRAREAGWRGALASADRRPGVAERYGKASQAKLRSCDLARRRTGRCPSSCPSCNPAEPARDAPRTSSAPTAWPTAAPSADGCTGGSSGSTPPTRTSCSPSSGGSATRCAGPTAPARSATT